MQRPKHKAELFAPSYAPTLSSIGMANCGLLSSLEWACLILVLIQGLSIIAVCISSQLLEGCIRPSRRLPLLPWGFIGFWYCLKSWIGFYWCLIWNGLTFIELDFWLINSSVYEVLLDSSTDVSIRYVHYNCPIFTRYQLIKNWTLYLQLSERKPCSVWRLNRLA